LEWLQEHVPARNPLLVVPPALLCHTFLMRMPISIPAFAALATAQETRREIVTIGVLQDDLDLTKLDDKTYR
jgi:hypothetical protein